jgi:hypothetical protein
MASGSRIGLRELITSLRTELLQAMVDGEGKQLRFLLDEIELDVEVQATREGGTGGGLSFEVLGAGVDGKIEGKLARTAMQRLKLKLKALDPADPDGDMHIVGRARRKRS